MVIGKGNVSAIRNVDLVHIRIGGAEGVDLSILNSRMDNVALSVGIGHESVCTAAVMLRLALPEGSGAATEVGE